MNPVVDYIVEEVRRQGHDVLAYDGIIRVGWMIGGWSYALVGTTNPTDKKNSTPPDFEDAVKIGRLVEPYKNKEGIRTCGVRVGMRVCPKPEQVERLLTKLFESRDDLTPMEFYKEFEEIHPFVDGNGRTGKILLNWMNGSLLKPIFPPADLFGHPIINP